MTGTAVAAERGPDTASTPKQGQRVEDRADRTDKRDGRQATNLATNRPKPLALGGGNTGWAT
jgi:hypothetical protein